MTGTRLGQVPIVASWIQYGVDLQRNRNARQAGSEVKLGVSGACRPWRAGLELDESVQGLGGLAEFGSDAGESDGGSGLLRRGGDGGAGRWRPAGRRPGARRRQGRPGQMRVRPGR
jgi:hypothetical protein